MSEPWQIQQRMQDNKTLSECLEPDCPLSTDVLLEDDGCVSHAQVLPPLPPPADMFLDGHAGSPQLIQTQLLEISYLTSSEEDLSPTKLVLVGVLEIKPRGQSYAQTCSAQ